MADTEMKPVKEFLSPKELATVIGASESSIKRWIDEGRITAVRTPGGHRRIPASAVADLLRSQAHDIHDPAPLGFANDDGGADLAENVERFTEAIKAGDARAARDLAMSRFFRGQAVADVCAQLIQPGWQSLRDACPHPSERCFTLHRARSICQQILEGLRPFVMSHQPRLAAVGGDIGYEIDALPSAMCDLVLAEVGFATTQLGSMLEQAILRGVVESRRAPLLWLSASGPVDADSLLARLQELDRLAQTNGIQVIALGGAWEGAALNPFAATTYCRDWGQVQAFAKGMLVAAAS